MRAQRIATFKGLTMMFGFLVVLVFLFMPVFDGHNAMEFLDNLYNSISKGSADYAGAVRDEILKMREDAFRMEVEMASEKEARRSDSLLKAAGVDTSVSGNRIEFGGNLKQILMASIDDSKIMFRNDGESIVKKYGYDELSVLYSWWTIFNKMKHQFTNEKRFSDAKKISLVQNKVIECSYNYYGIESQSIADQYFIVILSLIFYVLYTVWYGFGIMYLFEGWGMKLGH
jgi:hypothetical protein